MQLRYQMKHGHRDAHPRWCEVSKNPGFWLKLWPDSHQDFLPKLKLVWRFHIFLTFDQTHWKPESSAPFPNIFPTGKAMAFPFHRTHWRFSWDGLETRSRLSPASLGKDTQRPCDRWPRQSEFFFWFRNGSSTTISWLGHVKPSWIAGIYLLTYISQIHAFLAKKSSSLLNLPQPFSPTCPIC